jgi:crossover junction endodeoxyribonuclease RuvC
VLGIDPGLVATGFGVLERVGTGFAVRDAGVIATTTTLAFEERLRIIYEGIRDVLVKHTPDVVVLEDLYAEYKFPRTALLMAHARGVVCLAAGECAVPVMALAPAEVKRTVAFNGAASKEQVQRSIGRLLTLPEPPHPSHVADALALAWTGFSRAGREAINRGPERAGAARPASPAIGEPSGRAKPGSPRVQ